MRQRIAGFGVWTAVALIVLVPLFGCGSDEAPTAPAASVTWDDITVTLHTIDVIRACDGGGPGEFAYKFYAITDVDGTETTVGDEALTSFTMSDGQLWDNVNNSVSFSLPRRAGAEFRVRVWIRELDTVEDFSEGRFYRHQPDRSSEELWQPDQGGYASYSNSQRNGDVVFEINARTDCRVRMEYTVNVSPR